MAHYDLEEQEQIDSLRTWWRMYGNLVTGLISAVAIVVVAWQGWTWYQRSQSAQASMIYGALEQAVAAGDAQRVKATAGELTEKFGGTAYAPLGALMAAKVSFDASDLKTARTQLAWVAQNGKDEVRDLARLRLAAVLLDEKAYDEALRHLDGAHGAAFDARFGESRGDVLAAQGKKTEAKAAYQGALAALKTKDTEAEASRNPYRQLLEQKLNSLGGEA